MQSDERARMVSTDGDPLAVSVYRHADNFTTLFLDAQVVCTACAVTGGRVYM